MAATKENIYMNTNMVTIQRADHTSLHGIESNFNQTRVLPIVGKTSRAEIALKSADVQTKALPMFQPQVALGTDINRLIYETGLSASWRNSMLMIPPDNVSLSTLLFEGAISYPGGSSSVWRGADRNETYYGVSTFTNDSTAHLPIIDTYNVKYDLTLFPAPLVNTQLSVLFDYWNADITSTAPSALRQTCLTPVVVPSESEHIMAIQVISSGLFAGNYLVLVQDTSGFAVGDRIRFFGTSYTDTPLVPMNLVFGSVLDVVTADQQVTAFSSHLPALIISSEEIPIPIGPPVGFYYFQYNPIAQPNPTVTFSTDTGVGTIVVGQQVQVLCEQNTEIEGIHTVIAITNGNMDVVIAYTFIGPPDAGRGTLTPITPAPNAEPLENGYVINQTVKNGGHIEFLTDEYEFAPIPVQGTKQEYSGLLTVTYDNLLLPSPIYDQGFWRGCSATSVWTEFAPMTSAVELIITDVAGADPTLYSYYAKIFNGYYTISSRPDPSTFLLAPLSKALPLNTDFDLTAPQVTFTLKLAPNYYTFDTKADEIIDPILTPQKLSFMRSLGFIPTDDIPIKKPTYPPTASVPINTWTRAFQVAWDFSAYRNLTWVPQDTMSPKPQAPIYVQDFGFDNGSSTYYNVYEFNKFLNDCVNPSMERCINDTTYEVPSLDALSLNNQLALAFNAYKGLLTSAQSNYVWSSTETYNLGDVVVKSDTNQAWVFMCAVEQTTTILPSTPTSNRFWYFLGLSPNSSYITPIQEYELALTETNLNGFKLMTAKVLQSNPNIYYPDITIAYVPTTPGIPNPSSTQIIDIPEFRTVAPIFHYNELTLLSSIKYDGYSFGTTNVNHTGLSSKQIALYNYNRLSWGFQGYEHADEWMTFESNTSFKFLLDNFPSYCTSYEDTLAELRAGGVQYPMVSYWVWDNTSSVDPRREPIPFYEIYQTSESLSSCMSPVQSIVVVSDNIPVLEELASPVNYLVDSESSSFTNSSATIGLTQKIIGEFTLPSFAPYNSRSIINFDSDELKFYSLLDTKLFKQLEYSLYYRHRIAQQLVPLIISNYGSVNIKFVFRPIS
jgi:hypothetical protein